jgi:hypothetical protein
MVSNSKTRVNPARKTSGARLTGRIPWSGDSGLPLVVREASYVVPRIVLALQKRKSVRNADYECGLRKKVRM